MVDQQCRKSDRQVKIIGYTALLNELAHHQITDVLVNLLGLVTNCTRLATKISLSPKV